MVDGPPRGAVHVAGLLEVSIVTFTLAVNPDQVYPLTYGSLLSSRLAR
jgi:hypothetical protein